MVISRFLVQPGWGYEQVNLGFAFAVNYLWNKTFTVSQVKIGAETIQNFELSKPVTLPTIKDKGIDFSNLGALGAFKADTFDVTGDGRADTVAFIFRDGKWGYGVHEVGDEMPR